MTDRESYIENAPPIAMGSNGKLNFVAEGAPPWPIVIVPDEVMADAAKLAAFLYLRSTNSSRILPPTAETRASGRPHTFRSDSSMLPAQCSAWCG
jgi:hypothetical protein